MKAYHTRILLRIFRCWTGCSL